MSAFARAYAAAYDFLADREDRRGAADLRALLVGPAGGEVLELGAGTGRCLPWYTAARSIVALEPDDAMRARARIRAVDAPIRTDVIDGDAMRLPFGDASFDTVVTAWVMCMVPDPAIALSEIRRVLRPGGTYRFCEHVRASDSRLARQQDLMAMPWRVVSRGCRCNQDTLAMIRGAGFDTEADYFEFEPSSPRIVRPTVLGSARSS